MREVIIYLMVGAGSLLMISYLPHMFMDGVSDPETIFKVQVGVTVFWFFVLSGLGWDIVRRRRGGTQR